MEFGITLERLEVGQNGRPLAYDAYGNKVEITLDDNGLAVAFDADGNKIEIEECDEECGVYYAVIIHRNAKDIAEATEHLFYQVWYSRHLIWINKVMDGKDIPCPKILKGALNAAQELRDKYGEELLLPKDDFEWGMINGKLSALRWVFGYNWDFLGT